MQRLLQGPAFVHNKQYTIFIHTQKTDCCITNYGVSILYLIWLRSLFEYIILFPYPTSSSNKPRHNEKLCIWQTLNLLMCGYNSTNTKTERNGQKKSRRRRRKKCCHVAGVTCNVSRVTCHLSHGPNANSNNHSHQVSPFQLPHYVQKAGSQRPQNQKKSKR